MTHLPTPPSKFAVLPEQIRRYSNKTRHSAPCTRVQITRVSYQSLSICNAQKSTGRKTGYVFLTRILFRPERNVSDADRHVHNSTTIGEASHDDAIHRRCRCFSWFQPRDICNATRSRGGAARCLLDPLLSRLSFPFYFSLPFATILLNPLPL